jgi:microcompartment protein CcmK/EutM
MYMARVVGDVVSSHRHPDLSGKKLLLLRRLDLDGREEAGEIIALDVIGVGAGERVLVVQEGGSARTLFKATSLPVQAVVVGVIDRVDLGAAPNATAAVA